MRLDKKVDELGVQLRTECGAELRTEIHSLRADVASDLLSLEKRLGDGEKRLSEQITGLGRSVTAYHSSTVGYGVLISEFEDRLRRVEQRLDMYPPEPH